MPDLLPHQRETLLREGSFNGLKTLSSRREIAPSVVSGTLAAVYRALLVEIAEAKKELVRLQTSLAAMEGAARAGAASRNGTLHDPTADRFTNSLITFDAWAVSLIETDLTMTGLLNPAHTRNKIVEFSKAMNALMDKRATEKHPVIDDPSLFRGYVDR